MEEFAGLPDEFVVRVSRNEPGTMLLMHKKLLECMEPLPSRYELSNSAREFLSLLLAKEDTERLSAQDALKHQWLNPRKMSQVQRPRGSVDRGLAVLVLNDVWKDPKRRRWSGNLPISCL